MGIRRPVAVAATLLAALALTACVPSAPPTPAQLSEQFGDPIEPAWRAEVPGLYGEPVVRNGLVLAYATDDEVGLRLTVHSLESGELRWEHAASPGGAGANPLLISQDSALRTNPLPTIRPLVVDRGTGDEAKPVVVFFERHVPEEQEIEPTDLLRVADARTGENLEVTVRGIEEDMYGFPQLGTMPDGEVFANTTTPGFPCGDGLVCFAADEADAFSGSARIVLDVEALEARYETGYLPAGSSSTAEWGPGFVRITEDETTVVARFEDGEERWRATVDELFGVERTSPADEVDFARVGDLVLIQGYQPILETLTDQAHTLSIDFVTSRTLIAVEAATGEVVWRLPGGDMLCHAVRGRPVPDDSDSIPICLATAGSYVYDIQADEMVDEVEVEASIAELRVVDGQIGWQVEGAGTLSMWNFGRQLDTLFASRGGYAVEQVGEDPVLVSLTEGESVTLPKDATFVCTAERADVELEFEGSVFAGGGNSISSDYPAGWYHFPCDADGEEVVTWSRGAVRVGGYGDPQGTVVLALQEELVAFELD